MDGGADTWAAIEDPSSEKAEALKQIIKDNYVKMITKEGVIPLITPDVGLLFLPSPQTN